YVQSFSFAGGVTPRKRKRTDRFDVRQLTKGQLRKLTALRKSLGEGIADNAFAEWFRTQGQNGHSASDRNSAAIREAVESIVLQGKARMPRGGLLIRRGRGRVIVEQPED